MPYISFHFHFSESDGLMEMREKLYKNVRIIHWIQEEDMTIINILLSH